MSPVTTLQEYLEANAVKYQAFKHPAAFTAEEAAAVEHVRGREHAKVVILRTDSKFVMIVLPAIYHVDFERARRAIGNPGLELATEDEIAHLFPGCEPGAMPPFGNLWSMPVWVDDSLAADEDIVFSACSHSESIRMKFTDFARLVHPKVALLRTEELRLSSMSKVATI
jgi:Ala-tRNA(Pro) deacylase